MMNVVRYAGLTLAATLAGCAANPSAVGLPQTGTQALGQAANATTQAGAMATGAGTLATTAGSAVKSASLTDLLVSQLGVSNQQAMGGAGAIFELAKQNMSVGDFGKVSAAVPGMSGLLAAAPALSGVTGGGSGLLGAAAGMMGGQGGSLASMARLVLQRGYALLTDTEGAVVSSVRQAPPGAALRATLADGVVDVSVVQPRLL